MSVIVSCTFIAPLLFTTASNVSRKTIRFPPTLSIISVIPINARIQPQQSVPFYSINGDHPLHCDQSSEIRPPAVQPKAFKTSIQ